MFKDEKLQARQEKYRKSKIDLIGHREKHNLTLRKTKLDNFILQKRLKKTNMNINNFGIIPLTLTIEEAYRKINPDDLKNEEIMNTVFNLLSSSEDHMKFAIYLIRQYISVDHNVDHIILLKKGFLNLCQNVLSSSEDSNLIFEILWILTNLSYMCSLEDLAKLTEPAFIETYIKILNNSDINEITLQILWLLRNIVCDVEQFRNEILSTKIIDMVVEKINLVLDFSLQEYNCIRFYFLKSSIDFLYNLVNTFYSYPPYLLHQVYKLIVVFTNINLYTHDEIFNMCLWSLNYISDLDGPDETIIPKLILNENGNIINTLLAIDYEVYRELIMPTLHILGNILYVYDTEIVNLVLDFGVIDFLDSILLREKNKKIIQEVLWVVSNICGGEFGSIKQIVEADIFDKIIQVCSDYDYSTKKEAIFIVMNICTNKINLTISTFLVRKGIFKLIINLLESDNDSEILAMALTSLQSILTTGIPIMSLTGCNNLSKKFELEGGISALEKMQGHSNDKIYNQALNILETFFQTHVVSYSDLVSVYSGNAMEEDHPNDNDMKQFNKCVYNDVNFENFKIPLQVQSANFIKNTNKINTTKSFHQSLSLENENYSLTNQNQIEDSNKYAFLFAPNNSSQSQNPQRNFYQDNK